MPKKRLSLMERQQALLEASGFSKPKSKPKPKPKPRRSRVNSLDDGRRFGKDLRRNNKKGGHKHSKGFMKRQEEQLMRKGRYNAASASRMAVPMPDESMGFDGEDDSGNRIGGGGNATYSVASRVSNAPSLHPSMAGTMVSMACSEMTIGAGDDTNYWDFQHRTVERKDLGHRCRECRQPFTTLGEPLTERRGARISTRYHAACFSGYADPRSQASSSHHHGHLAGTQYDAAPTNKAGSKMRTSSHFSGSGLARGGGAYTGVIPAGTRQNDKIAAFMGGMGFGAASSKGAGMQAAPLGKPGGLTEEQLAEHTRRMKLDEGSEEKEKNPMMADFLASGGPLDTIGDGSEDYGEGKRHTQQRRESKK